MNQLTGNKEANLNFISQKYWTDPGGINNFLFLPVVVPDFLDFFSWTNFSCSFWKSPKIVWKTHRWDKPWDMPDTSTHWGIIASKCCKTCLCKVRNPTLSIMLSIFPSSTVFLMVCAVSTTDSEIFFVAVEAKLNMKSVGGWRERIVHVSRTCGSSENVIYHLTSWNFRTVQNTDHHFCQESHYCRWLYAKSFFALIFGRSRVKWPLESRTK